MKKIVDFEICDIVPYSNGIILLKKKCLTITDARLRFMGMI